MSSDIELLAPAGSTEALKAAVQSGADAVYFGGGAFNARRNAKNFTDDEMEDAIKYCRARGVKTYATVNIQLTNSELVDALKLVEKFYLFGIDGIITADLGLAALIKKAAPDLKINASTQMSVHNLEGVMWLYEHGFDRVVLARELSLKDIKKITEKSPIETEIFVHGALCMAYSGQCYMSAFLGGRSGSRGLCAQPCRLMYSLGGDRGHLLSLRDLSLGDYIDEIRSLGVSSLKIEGRMKRAEYTAAVTSAYANALKGEGFSEETKDRLSRVFSRGGFTDGYFTGKIGRDMFGYRDEKDKKNSRDFNNILKSVIRDGHEYNRIPVSFNFTAKYGRPALLCAKDGDCFFAECEGSVPQRAQKRALNEETVKAALKKTGDTPFYAESFNIDIDSGISLPIKDINALRREVLTQLINQRVQKPVSQFDIPSLYQESGEKAGILKLQAKYYNINQVPSDRNSLPDKVWLAVDLVLKNQADIKNMLNSGMDIGLYMPRVVHDTEMAEIYSMLKAAKELQIQDILSGNIGLCRLLLNEGFSVHGDFGLNIFNSDSLSVLKDTGLKSSVLSFELAFSQISSMTKALPCGIIAYGRAPLMIFKNCIVKDREKCGRCESGVFLHDRKDEDFIILKEFGCRNILLNAKTTYLADREDYKKLGLSFIRLDFYTETQSECNKIIKQYRSGGEAMQDITRGLYYKGVL